MERIGAKGERHTSGGPGSFYLGRSEEIAPAIAREHAGEAQLIYLDPPFGTGDTFSMRAGGKKKLTIPTYADRLDDASYLAMMREVLTACHTLLRPDGSLFLHVDYRKSAQMRLLLDEIFGAAHFVNEIIWAYKSGGRSTKHFSYKHDTILFYKKSAKHYFNIEAAGVKRGPERRNHMKRSIDAQGRICYSIRSNGKTYTYHEESLVYPSDVWDDIEHLHQRDPERTGYNTQKPEALLRRILEVATKKDDLVIDFFSGSATTAVTAMKLGRRWLAADASPLALSTLRKRMLLASSPYPLLDARHDMLLSYQLDDLDIAPPKTLMQGERLCVFPPQNVLLQYAALGFMENGIFLPQSYDLAPSAEEPLSAPRQEGLVWQAVDHYGKQAFWKLD